MNRVPQLRMPLDSSLTRASALALVAAAAIHAAAAPVDFAQDPLHGSLFAVVAGAQALAGVALLVSGSRRVLVASAALSAGMIAAWVVSRTVGIPGIDVAEMEAVGVADTAATGFELLVIATALAVVLSRSRVTARLLLPATAWLSIVAFGIVAVAVPTVSAGPRHENADAHGDAAHQHSGPAGQDLLAHNEQHGSNAILFGEHSHAEEPCAPTPEQQAAADKLLTDTKRDLQRLASVETAKAEGFMRYGDAAILGTWHYINWKYQADPDVLNTMKPESIVYWQATPESPMILIGAMYLVPGVNDVGPAVGGCLTTWHVHGEPFSAPDVVTPEMLHVWLIPLPSGPFN